MNTQPDPKDPFLSAILAVMDCKDHAAWPHFSGPGASVRDLEVHFRQEYAVYVRDFPVFLARVHSRCPHPEVRQELAKNLYEEETGGLSGTGPHPELFLRMMEGLGLARHRFENVTLLPAACAYREWLDEVTLHRHWLAGAAAITLFVEGSVHDRRELEGKPSPALSLDREPLVRYHGVDPRHLTLKAAHAQVEGDHRLSAWRTIAAHAQGAARRRAVQLAMERSLRLWLAYRDDVARACGLHLRVALGF